MVDLAVGEGLSNERTMIPELVGLSIDEAKDALIAVSLNYGALFYDSSFSNAEDSSNAVVWKNNPISSTTDLVQLGKSVDLWLTIDQEKIDINTEIGFQHKLIVNMYCRIFEPGKVIISYGQKLNEMYFVTKGTAIFFDSKGVTPFL